MNPHKLRWDSGRSLSPGRDLHFSSNDGIIFFMSLVLIITPKRLSPYTTAFNIFLEYHNAYMPQTELPEVLPSGRLAAGLVVHVGRRHEMACVARVQGLWGKWRGISQSPALTLKAKDVALGRFTAHVHIFVVGEKQSSGLWWGLVLGFAALWWTIKNNVSEIKSPERNRAKQSEKN